MAKLSAEDSFYFYKKQETDKIWWVNFPRIRGIMAVSFNKKKILNLFSDYPRKFSAKEKALFDEENPYWANYFKDRE